MKPIRIPPAQACACWLTTALFATGLLPATMRGVPVATTTYIPVIVNLYSNCNVTPTEAAEAIKDASRILGQAGLKLVVIKTNNPPGAGNGDNGDGSFTDAEFRGILTYGGKELTNSPGGKGINISFANTPYMGDTTPGWSIHRNPTIVVKKRDTTNDTGQTIAHEIGHVMTLGPRHVISPGSNADAGGHTPPITNSPAGNGNIMAPSNRRTGTHLTTNQIDEICSNRWKHGMCAVQFANNFPAQREQIQSAAHTDAVGDAGAGGGLVVPGWFDLDQVFLTSVADDPLLRAEVVVNAPLVNPEPIAATYGLGFNTDADPATGTPYGGYAGIDRIVFIHVAGNPADGTLTVSGEVLDTVSGLSVALPTPPQVFINYRLVDRDAPGQAATTAFVCDIPKALLELSAAEVPVVATAGLHPLVFDATEGMVFDQLRWLRDPLLQTYGTGVPTPGAPYPISLEGMTPNRPFRLMLNDTVVLSGLLNGAGAFAGTFVFPVSQPNTQPHFLYALDGTVNFAYSMTCPSNTEAATISIERQSAAVQLTFTVPNEFDYVVERTPVVGPAEWVPWYSGGGRGWPVVLTHDLQPGAYFYRVGIKRPPAAPPVILQQPLSLTVPAGQTAAFFVGVGGTPPFTYQWFFNTQPLPGATTNPLVLLNAQPSQQGVYWVVVTNAVGFAQSDPAQLMVMPGGLLPALVSAAPGADPRQIVLAFNKPVDPEWAGNPDNYIVDDGFWELFIDAATVLPGNTQVILLLNPLTPLEPDTRYEVTAYGVRDLEVPPNVNPQSTVSFFTQ